MIPSSVADRSWPNWSAPLLGAGGGALAGLAIQGDPHPPASALLTIACGGLIGFLAGLFVWFKNWINTDPEPILSEPVPVGAEGLAVQPTRRLGLIVMVTGLVALTLNHASVVFRSEKHFELVLGGICCSVFGLGVLLFPGILRRVPGEFWSWRRTPLEVGLTLVSLALGTYLWVVVYA